MTSRGAITALIVGALSLAIGFYAGSRWGRAVGFREGAERVTDLEAHIDQLEQRLLARGPVRTRQQDWDEMKARMERLKTEHPEKFAQMEPRRTGLKIIRKKRSDKQSEAQ